MSYFALIKNQSVEAVVVGDSEFVEHIKSKYDQVIDVTDRERPTPGDSYYSDTDSFISNLPEIHELSVDEIGEHLTQGTEGGFEPFQLSKYSVKYENGMIQIGCKKYSAVGFMDSLHKILIEKQQTNECFTVQNGKPRHGKFDITWDDVQKLYDALSKVKLP